MKLIKRVLLLLIGLIAAVFLLSAAGYVWNQYFSQTGDSKVYIGKNTLNVDLATTPIEWSQGLSGRKNLPENSGMLFIFSQPAIYSFWMKDMNFPLDIIWIGPDNRVVDITQRLSPKTYPESFSPAYPASRVLEVNSGWVARHNVDIGETVSYSNSIRP